MVCTIMLFTNTLVAIAFSCPLTFVYTQSTCSPDHTEHRGGTGLWHSPPMSDFGMYWTGLNVQGLFVPWICGQVEWFISIWAVSFYYNAVYVMANLIVGRSVVFDLVSSLLLTCCQVFLRFRSGHVTFPPSNISGFLKLYIETKKL